MIRNYFNLKEFFIGCSPLEIKYACYNSYVMNNLFRLVQIMQTIRYTINSPIFITSGFRDETHNKRVGGVNTSQHLFGSACDFTVNPEEREKIIKFVSESVEFGQFIIYPTFFHISLPTNKLNHKILKQNANGTFTTL